MAPTTAEMGEEENTPFAYATVAVGHQARLVAPVGGTPNAAAEQDEAAVTLARADHLVCIPGKRCPIARDEHQTGLRAGDQQRSIVQPEPRPIQDGLY